jgi:hypothetical protein
LLFTSHSCTERPCILRSRTKYRQNVCIEPNFLRS